VKPVVEPLRVPDGTLEALKWLALALMTGDHINRFLFLGTLPFLTEAARISFPIFAAILAYNLARPNAGERGVHKRVIVRLTIFGILASVPYYALDAGILYVWWPLNAMFALLLIAVCIRLLESRIWHAMPPVLLFAGILPEYFFFGIGFGLSVWWYCKRPNAYAGLLVLTCCLSLWIVNGTPWALMALPILLSAHQIELRFPRLRWWFYAYYPLHLAVLWAIRIPMRAAGYIFI
jgi:hypothetical protein